MKIETATQQVIECGILESETMTINPTDPVLFQALSDTLYTGARWILEYAQNAQDVDPHWTLHLPTLIEPYVEFIDNGPSMEPDFMLSRGTYRGRGFCTIFSSTKRDDDTAMGGYGIGRLSGPQGTIFICRNADAIRTYVLVKNAATIPEMKCLSVEPRPNDVPVGVTVRVPIEMGDINSTCTSIFTVLRFFGLANVPSPTYRLRGSNWAVMNESAERTATIIVGNYPYVLQRDLARNLRTPYAEMQKLVIWLPVGAVDVTLNRESIKDSEKTRRTLQQAFEQFAREFATRARAQIDAAPTWWDAYLLRRHLITANYSISRLIPDSYHGRALPETFMIHQGATNSLGIWRGWSLPTQAVKFKYDIQHFHFPHDPVVILRDTTHHISKRILAKVSSVEELARIVMVSPEYAETLRQKAPGIALHPLSEWAPLPERTTVASEPAEKRPIGVFCITNLQSQTHGTVIDEEDKVWMPFRGSASPDKELVNACALIPELRTEFPEIIGVPTGALHCVKDSWARFRDLVPAKLKSREAIMACERALAIRHDGSLTTPIRLCIQALKEYDITPDLRDAINMWEETTGNARIVSHWESYRNIWALLDQPIPVYERDAEHNAFIEMLRALFLDTYPLIAALGNVLSRCYGNAADSAAVITAILPYVQKEYDHARVHHHSG